MGSSRIFDPDKAIEDQRDDGNRIYGDFCDKPQHVRCGSLCSACIISRSNDRRYDVSERHRARIRIAEAEEDIRSQLRHEKDRHDKVCQIALLDPRHDKIRCHRNGKQAESDQEKISDQRKHHVITIIVAVENR